MLNRNSFLIILTIGLMLFPKLGIAQTKIIGTHTVLWKITSDRSAKTAYLLGSVHSFNDAWIDSWPIIDSLVSIQDLMVSENNLAVTTTKNITLIPKTTALKAKDYFGKDLILVKNHFDKTYGADIIKFLDTAERSNELLQGLLQLLQNDYMFKRGLKISESLSTMDDIISLSAIAKGKKHFTLDSTIMIRQMIEGNGWINSRAERIIEMVKEVNGLPLTPATKKDLANFNEVITLYNAGLFRYTDKQVSDEGVKTTSRNKYWMTKLPQILQENNAFIVVGINHLEGSEGLLNMLDKKGYKISPIKLR